MINENQYRELKQEVEAARNEATRAQGALDQLIDRLKDEFECESLKEAKTLLTSLETKREEADEDFEKAFADYQKRWKES